MSKPRDDPGKLWPPDPDAPDPTVVVPGWPDLETALRERAPDETGAGALPSTCWWSTPAPTWAGSSPWPPASTSSAGPPGWTCPSRTRR